MGQIIMSASICVIAVVLFFQSFGFPEIVGTPDAGFWPRIIAGLLIIFSGLAMWESIGNRKKEAAIPESERPKPEDSESYDPQGKKRLYGTVAILFFYMIIGLNYLGFLLATIIFAPVLMIWLGNKKPIQIGVNSLAIVTTCYLVFCKFMMIPLPRGVSIFRDFSLLFY